MELIQLFQTGTGWYSECYQYACQNFARNHHGNTLEPRELSWGEMVKFTYTVERCVETRYVQSQKLAFFIVAAMANVHRAPIRLPSNLFSLVYLAVQGVYERNIWVSGALTGQNCGHYQWWNNNLGVASQTFHLWTPGQCTLLAELVEYYRSHRLNNLSCGGCKLCSPG